MLRKAQFIPRTRVFYRSPWHKQARRDRRSFPRALSLVRLEQPAVAVQVAENSSFGASSIGGVFLGLQQRFENRIPL